ncbi:MAG TPA: hypothetical protein PLL64_13590 [Rhodothermales bacterium]|nr:hypothetical protein [Bacteroidota bacterium]HRK75309.1 hypothetical protein [Rhodothermales bacterium]HRR07328.1 hypothetical protein [Rhodothermales bacterium]
MLKTYAQKLLQLKREDDNLRQTLLDEGVLFEGYHAEMEALHNRNAVILGKIIDQIGYPSSEKVGEAASEAAWLILQHAIGSPELMRKGAVLLAQAVQEGRESPVKLAYITDRIAVFEGKPQHYGTQFDWDDRGELSPAPYDALEAVNQRRAAVGLCAIEEQTRLMRERATAEHQMPPQNHTERQATYERWRKRVGWGDNLI